MEQCRRLCEADHPVTHLMKGIVNPNLLRERKRGMLPVLHVNKINCGKKQYITARLAVKSNYCTRQVL
jgi:hypothetical protein